MPLTLYGFFLAFLWALSSYSAPLTLQQALKESLSVHPDLQQSLSQLTESEALVSEYRSELFPKINAVGSFENRKNSSTITSTSASSTNSSSTRDIYTAALELTQPLYQGGALISGLRLGEITKEIARQNMFSKKQQIAQEIITAYFDWVQALDNLKSAEENLAILKAYHDTTVRYEKIGRARAIDRMQATVNYNLSTLDVDNIRSTYTAADIQLRRLVQAPADRTMEPQYRPNLQKLEAPTPEQALETSRTNNPNLRALELKIEEQKLIGELDLSTELPSLNLLGSTGYTAPDRDRLFDSTSQFYSIGINLKIPLFSGLSSFAKRRQSSEKMYQAKKILENELAQIKASISTLIDSAKNSWNQLKVLQESMRTARRALDMANAGYRQGVVSNSDIVNFQRSRYEAEKLLLKTQYEYMQTLLELRRLLGIDLEKIYASQ